MSKKPKTERTKAFKKKYGISDEWIKTLLLKDGIKLETDNIFNYMKLLSKEDQIILINRARCLKELNDHKSVIKNRNYINPSSKRLQSYFTDDTAAVDDIDGVF